MISTNYCRTSSYANPRQLISLAYCCKLKLSATRNNVRHVFRQLPSPKSNF